MGYRKYGIIYADPGWVYRDKANAGKRGASHKYSETSMEYLTGPVFKKFIDGIAAKDCLLALWWTPPLAREALAVVDALDFELITMKGFTWHKLTKTGKDHFGMGHWTRANTEDCLFARRGRPRRVSASVRQLVHAPVLIHSRKPNAVRDGLVALMGDIPRIELFARERHEGWDAWGDELTQE